MYNLKENASEMTVAERQAAVNALRRILNPAKGVHLPTLVLMTGEMFTIEVGEGPSNG